MSLGLRERFLHQMNKAKVLPLRPKLLELKKT
jgi:hypothetical protein